MIFLGIRNLVEKKYARRINWVIYNRNPDTLKNKAKWGNSWKNQSLSKIDKIIIAGTLEWFGKPLEPLFIKIVEEKRSITFLGIGYIAPTINFSDIDKKVLSTAELITTRDSYAKQCCAKIGVNTITLPCPCIFASSKITVKNKNKIAVVYQSDKTINQSISSKLKETLNKAILEFNAAVVCHYIDEYFEAINKYKEVYYSFDANDYIEIYNNFDLVISARLHGALTAISCGTPAVLLNEQNPRLTETAKVIPVLKTASNLDEVKRIVQNSDIVKWSEEICHFKQAEMEKYLTLLI